MKTFILVFLGFVAFLNLTSELYNIPKLKKNTHINDVGIDFCDGWSYYLTENSTQFCLTTQIGLFLSFLGSTIYILMWILCLPILIWMVLNTNEI
ncbi:hypothetical protein Indivirus_6_19 [Indivirus ILV1]|uniref:Uncharacterized protein n=1 Tax=Indivirus ILV1 TaxID=1977633 RepID=A0A1V0SE16_9VIRU|nr:hypothetical protein Indivirus_6_19 [Indivirus ILV1]